MNILATNIAWAASLCRAHEIGAEQSDLHREFYHDATWHPGCGYRVREPGEDLIKYGRMTHAVCVKQRGIR